MHDLKQKFVQILIVELADLEQDIIQIMEEYTSKHDHDVITNYVFQENLALSQRELFGIDGFAQDVKSISINNFTSVEDLLAELKKTLAERVSSNGLPKAIEILVNRKLDKVYHYINH